MTVRDILMQMTSYPQPTPAWALEASVAFARAYGATLSIGLCQVHVPPISNWLADTLINADNTIAAENHKSRENAQELLAHFAMTVDEDHKGDALLLDCLAMGPPRHLAARASAYDLTIVPFHDQSNAQAVIESLIFESGRPVLLLPHQDKEAQRFDHIVIGWDGSRAAARALSDALPFCRDAKRVTVASVLNDKDLSNIAPIADVVRHLARHGIAADTVTLLANGDNAGVALDTYCEGAGADLLVMGAYGSSRLREFILGGATRSVLAAPKRPILLSH